MITSTLQVKLWCKTVFALSYVSLVRCLKPGEHMCIVRVTSLKVYIERKLNLRHKRTGIFLITNSIFFLEHFDLDTLKSVTIKH